MEWDQGSTAKVIFQVDIEEAGLTETPFLGYGPRCI
jgi:hypothetical protein